MATEQTTHTFCIHDESVNTYGYRMLTSGCDYAEFLKNPLMLLNHDDWEMPIGRWENLRVEGGKIYADAIFDLEDKRGAEVARKVKHGFIKACSVGAWVEESDSNPLEYVEGQTEPTITKWKLREVSICPIGANHNALVLYDAYGARVAPEDYETLLTFSDRYRSNNKQKNIMNEEVKKMLQLSDGAGIDEVISSIKELVGKNSQLSEELSDLRKEKEERQKQELEVKRTHCSDLIQQAVKGGKLTPDQGEALACLFDAHPDTVLEVLSGFPSTKSVQEQLKKASKTIASLTDMSWDELDRSGKLPELRANYPDVYKRKYAEHFGTKK